MALAECVRITAGEAEFDESLTKAGVLLSLYGLTPPAKAARVSFSGDKALVTDGPFAEAKEMVGGNWVIQVRSRDEAVEWARRAPMLDGDVIEVRQVQKLADFPEDVRRFWAAHGWRRGREGSKRPGDAQVTASGHLSLSFTRLPIR